ncbi:MAG: hypothetical protein WEC75_02600 [Dehalococcoidia bacterium]
MSTVAVLGAGFTRAFVPSAPLLIDDYGIGDIVEAFTHFPHARRVLESSILPDGRVNIEQLLTRLDNLLPYDVEQGAGPQLALLRTSLMTRFRESIDQARRAERDEESLSAMAQLVIDERVECITFNYDDVFDEALRDVKGVTNTGTTDTYWHPDGGYGFFCKPSKTLIRESGMSPVVMDTTCILLLKLHGSINWRIRRGSSRPLAIDSIVHDEDWLPRGNRFGDLVDDDEPTTPDEAQRRRRVILDHLEGEPFIIPPVLVKGSLVLEPILRLVWWRALEALAAADRVLFLGYSMPLTDIAGQHLFREGIRPNVNVNVINYTPDGSIDQEIVKSYSQVLPWLGKDDFEFGGIVPWLHETTAREEH